MNNNLSNIDNIIILLYFIITLLIGLYVSRAQGSQKKQYFLAGKSLGWIVIGSSLFATSISSEQLVGLAGAGSIYGIGVGYFEWLSAIILLIIGWAFAPLLLKSNVFTIPQFLGKIFDNRTRVYTSIVSIFTYLFIKIGVALLAGGLVMNGVLGWDMLTSTVFIVLLTGLYTFIGGMKSVVFTQLFQVVILILGAFLLTVFSLNAIGGWEGLTNKLPIEYFSFTKPLHDLNISWIGILIGAPIIGIWYWSADQYIIQRILGAKGIRDAQKGTLLAAVLKVFPVFLLVIPGLVAATLYPSTKGVEVYSMMLSGSLLPIGIKGIVIAGFLSALMSSLSSAFNSASALFTLDIYSLIKPKVSDDELVLVGRLSTMLFVIFTIAIIPFISFFNDNAHIKLLEFQAYIAPPIVSVLLVGLFWKNASSIGAIWALLVGGSLGIVKIILSIMDPVLYENYLLLNIYDKINYLHFSILAFIISTILIISISSFTKRVNSFNHKLEKINSDENRVDLHGTIHQIDQRKIKLRKPNSEIAHK